MAAFINNDITTAGLIVLAKGVAGQKINYSAMATSRRARRPAPSPAWSARRRPSTSRS